ncbi:GNAT family N-acetyltransferase [Streptomyces sp. NPDC005438]|uniref:GNAT family N-acetyltransferase n=1 Tax=Streptomyces sp. NPDC005438 TaxID=3156880 RepID=UPI0033BA469D
MTTTLRPSGPERRQDGARTRAFDVLDNGRPVGGVTVSTDPDFPDQVGRIDELWVAPADRRRGRATVAMLAAEEVLRGWGCARAQLRVPGEAEGADALAGTLGYQERNRGMAKTLTGETAPPPGGITVRAMTEPEFADWWAQDQAELFTKLRGVGFTEEQARARAAAAGRDHLSRGLDTPGAVLRVLHDAEGTPLGTFWLSLGPDVPYDLDAWVFVVRVERAHRGRGYGRALMLAAERECRDAGAERLGLNVYSANTPAVRLYDSLGFQPFLRVYVKPL